MAKSRKKARKAGKRTAKKKRKPVTAKARRPAKRTRRAKRRKQTSIVDAVVGAARETRELRSRLTGPGTFED
jgi:hypothetical protein